MFFKQGLTFLEKENKLRVTFDHTGCISTPCTISQALYRVIALDGIARVTVNLDSTAVCRINTTKFDIAKCQGIVTTAVYEREKSTMTAKENCFDSIIKEKNDNKQYSNAPLNRTSGKETENEFALIKACTCGTH